MVKAIFFDLDGTLCEPVVPFAEVFGEAMAPLLAQRPDVEMKDVAPIWSAALAVPGPSTTATCLGRVLRDCGIEDKGALAEHLAARLNKRWAASQRLLPGTRSVLERLQHGWPLGLITNGPSDAQRAVLAALDLQPYFRWLLVSGDADVGARKPDPAIFAHALALAACPPAAALYVGDSPANDVAGAAAAAWRTCWLNRLGQTRPETVPAPDLEVRDLAGLPAALASLTTG